MGIVDQMKKEKREITDCLKGNFVYQLLAARAGGIGGGRPIKKLKAAAVKIGACSDVFNISDVVNELILEKRVTLEFIGEEPYLWLCKEEKGGDQS